MPNQTDPAAIDEPAPPIPSCALDPAAHKQQETRYHSLAKAVSGIERTAELLTVQFNKQVDHVLLEQTLDVERQCCPFFVFQFDGREQRLAIGVRQADQTPALEALAAAFTSGSPGAARPGAG